MKFAFQELQDNKAIFDESHEGRRILLKSDSSTTMPKAESIVTEMNLIIQQAMTDALNFLDSCNGPLKVTQKHQKFLVRKVQS